MAAGTIHNTRRPSAAFQGMCPLSGFNKTQIQLKNNYENYISGTRQPGLGRVPEQVPAQLSTVTVSLGDFPAPAESR
jgi:hypothetical protein